MEKGDCEPLAITPISLGIGQSSNAETIVRHEYFISYRM